MCLTLTWPTVILEMWWILINRSYKVIFVEVDEETQLNETRKPRKVKTMIMKHLNSNKPYLYP